MKALFDTNILIDYLNGVEAARDEFLRYEQLLVSPITWIEVMVGSNKAEEQAIRQFLSRFEQVPINNEVSELAVGIRQNKKIRLPDAIIWACAKSQQALLVSRNTKDFPEDEPDVRVPYNI
jgi:predicted nucleic acid-binding protein